MKERVRSQESFSNQLTEKIKKDHREKPGLIEGDIKQGLSHLLGPTRQSKTERKPKIGPWPLKQLGIRGLFVKERIWANLWDGEKWGKKGRREQCLTGERNRWGNETKS